MVICTQSALVARPAIRPASCRISRHVKTSSKPPNSSTVFHPIMIGKNHQHRTNFFSTSSITITTSGLCYGMTTNRPSPCLLEEKNQRRRRPPRYGSTIPKKHTRGFTTTAVEDMTDGIKDRSDCPLCKKFGSGPCGDIFKSWLACTDEHPGKDANGEPLHLTACEKLAAKLGTCLESNSEYYEKYDADNAEEEDNDATSSVEELKEAWTTFVQEMECEIKENKYKAIPFPEKIQPQMQVRLDSRTGAAFFAPNEDNGANIIVAYVLDQNGDVLAAGSKNDMDMGNLGCVLQFLVSDSLESATARAIYDDGSESVTVIYTKTMSVPRK